MEEIRNEIPKENIDELMEVLANKKFLGALSNIQNDREIVSGILKSYPNLNEKYAEAVSMDPSDPMRAELMNQVGDELGPILDAIEKAAKLSEKRIENEEVKEEQNNDEKDENQNDLNNFDER